MRHIFSQILNEHTNRTRSFKSPGSKTGSSLRSSPPSITDFGLETRHFKTGVATTPSPSSPRTCSRPDVLSIALESVPPEALKSPSFPTSTSTSYLTELHMGVEITHRLLLQTLFKYYVKPYDPMGEKFDPNKHEAMFQARVRLSEGWIHDQGPDTEGGQGRGRAGSVREVIMRITGGSR